MKGPNSNFLVMVVATLGLVLYVTLFNTIVEAMYTLYGTTNASCYTAFTTVVSIAPTVLFLGGVFGAGFAFYKGYKGAMSSSVNGLFMIVLGALQIILFVTLFSTIMTAMEVIRTYANIATFIALSTVVTIAPTVLLLGGIFAGGMSIAGGIRKRRKSAMAI